MKRSYLRKLYDRGKIVVISPDAKFNPDFQIHPDAIDLRLHPLAMKFKEDLSIIDTLASEIHIQKYLEPYPIPDDGLVVRPGELVFCKTLETVSIESDHHFGLVFGRRTIAGFGISITLDQPKFPPRLPWNFPLQIKNNASTPVKIYPYMPIAQLVIIEYPLAAKSSYTGIYVRQIDNYFPRVDEREQTEINNTIALLKDKHAEEVNKREAVIAELERHQKEEKKFWRRTGNVLGKLVISVAESAWAVLVSFLGLLVIEESTTHLLKVPFVDYVLLGVVIVFAYLIKFLVSGR